MLLGGVGQPENDRISLEHPEGQHALTNAFGAPRSWSCPALNEPPAKSLGGGGTLAVPGASRSDAWAVEPRVQ